jgi:hypothetical protein
MALNEQDNDILMKKIRNLHRIMILLKWLNL